MFASIIIDISSSCVDQYYEYSIPESLLPFASIGKRVKVEFNNRVIMGYIINIYEKKVFVGSPKEILDILDFEPVLTQDQIRLAEVLKEECICPLIRIFNLMVPNLLRLKPFKTIRVVNKLNIPADLLSLFNNEASIEYTKIPKELIPRIEKEIKCGNLEVIKDAKDVVTHKYKSVYSIDLDKYNTDKALIRGYLKQDFLKNNLDLKNATIEEIMEMSNLSIYQVKDLIKKGFLKETKVLVSRIQERNVEIELDDSYLNNNLTDELLKDKPTLFIPHDEKENLSGLLSVSQKILESKKTVVVFVPEILSTYTIASFLKRSLGIKVACINSNLGNAEYYDYYLAIKNNEYPVIVTSAKGLFLPYQNVGLYYLMNEDSENYYSDQSPRYDIHQVLFLLRRQNSASLILSSMSPSVTSYCYALKELYFLVDHHEVKVNNKIKLINTLDELKKGNTSYLSLQLQEKLSKDIDFQNVLLIVNNKNFATHILCRDCGMVPRCKTCGISLKYQEKTSSLVCPSCGKKIPFDKTCPTCHSPNLIYGGIGIESLMKELEKYPRYQKYVLSDATFDNLSNISNLLDEGGLNLVVTTPTLARSLNVDSFDVVALLSFDTTLKNPSFDAYSRAYSLLSFCNELLYQDGKLFIQSTDLNNYVITSFISNDYQDFVKHELESRKLERNVPFYHVNRIIIKAKYDEMFKCATTIKKVIMEQGKSNVFVMGPTYSKLQAGAILIIKHNYKPINEIYKKIYELYQSSSVTVIFDKHPRSL